MTHINNILKGLTVLNKTNNQQNVKHLCTPKMGKKTHNG